MRSYQVYFFLFECSFSLVCLLNRQLLLNTYLAFYKDAVSLTRKGGGKKNVKRMEASKFLHKELEYGIANIVR